MADVKSAIHFPDGSSYPVIGLGTFTIFGKTGGEEEVYNAVIHAIECGYRHIDGAYVYCNEDAIGRAIQQKIKDGTVKREDLFITSKLWDTFHKPELVESCIKKTLTSLQTNYVDLYLMHWPIGFKEGDELFPKDQDGNILFSDYDYVDTWKAMEKLVDSGLTRYLGISNFNKGQVERLIETARIAPVNNQIESHPYLLNDKLIEYCLSKKISITVYAPLGNPQRTWKVDGEPSVFEEPLLQEIAKSKNKSVAQVVLRFHLQRGLVVIPKSVTPSRIKENFQLHDFELTSEEMQKIKSLNRNKRFYKESIATKHKYYPFYDEY